MVTTTTFGHGGVELAGSAPVTFEHGSGQVDADIVVEWDLDNDGDFDEDVEDVTAYLVSLEAETGRDYPSQLTGKVSPGRLRLTLRNDLDGDEDRFSYFNVNSPLTQAPYSLKTGRKIRVRTAEAANPDPVLLARDRFRRDDNALIGATENGLSWTQHVAGSFEIVDQELSHENNDTALATIDVGVADYVVQVRLAETGVDTEGLGTNALAIVYRFQDDLNWSQYRLSYSGVVATVELIDTVAGTPSTIDSATLEHVEDLTLAVVVAGANVTGLVDGVPMVSGTAIQTDETEVGLYSAWSSGQPDPAFDDFYVWDGLPTQEDGIIWTGDIEKVVPRSAPGGDKVAEVTAIGRSARAATQDVPAPRFIAGSLVGQVTGRIVGHTLAQAGLLHPPGGATLIDPGTAGTGPVTDREPTRKALDVIRRFEEHEQGFFYETNEGYLGFDQRDARASKTSVVTLSDAPGAQFGYRNIEPHDREREIVNQVTAGVAHGLAELNNIYVTSAATGAGVANPVTFAIPAGTGDGDLLVLIIAWAGGSGSGETFLTPLWWVNERDIPGGSDQVRTRVYTHISNGLEVGTVYTFYADAGSNGGSEVVTALRFPAGQWYGTHEGIHVTEPQPGSNPQALIPPWGAVPTAYIAFRAGLSSSAGASVSGAIHPLGYGAVGANDSTFQNGATNSRDVGLQVSTRYSTDPIEDPGAFGGTFSGFTTVESGLIAIRGYNGSPPEEDLRLVTVNEYESQDDHNRIATHEQASSLHDTTANATDYAEAVVGTYSTDRPIFTVSFPATISAAYRAQAARRRVSDKVTLVAHNETGMLSEPTDFFIEHIRHSMANAGKVWTVTWELSPA